MKSKAATQSFKEAYRTGRAALAVLCIGLLINMASDKVVWRMKPIDGTWCSGPGYVQARFSGFKAKKDWRPVKGTRSARAIVGSRDFDVGFDFVNDPTPGSSKPWGFNTFGIWRWYADSPDAVLMSFAHTNGTRFVTSRYGYYSVPEGIAVCPEMENS